MSLKKRLADWFQFFQTLKTENINWQLANQDQQLQLKQAKVLAASNLEAELKKKSVELAHAIELLQTKQNTELWLLKTKCKQDIKDYKQYLAALDQLKRSIQASYTHLPEAVAFTIHHHAKQLLNQMWEAEDFEQKMQHELRLIQFMTTVHEEARLHLENASVGALPEKTLSLIQQQ